MKTITLTAWKRPHYLKEVIESLKANNTAGWSLIATLDQGHAPECYDLLHGIGFMPKHIVCLDTHHGAHYTNKHGFEVALGFGSTVNFAIEEDTVLAPDCLDLVDWWQRGADPAARGSRILNCFSSSRTTKYPELVGNSPRFHAWGWAAWRPEMEMIINQWCAYDPGWDISINSLCRDRGWAIIQPALSRMKNIGREDGAHYSPKVFDEHFGGTVCSDGKWRKYFFKDVTI